MMTRRTTLLLLGAAGVVLATGRSAPAQSADAAATAFVQQTGNQIVAVVNGSGTSEQKRPRMQQVIDQNVDVDEIARFSLGGAWRRATAEQQRTYLGLFHDVLLNNIVSKIGDYQGVRFTVGRASPRADTIVVNTTVDRPNNPSTQVDWVISSASGRPKIVDVVAEGTSLRLTQRSDYAAYLNRNNGSVDALIAAMRQQIASANAG